MRTRPKYRFSLPTVSNIIDTVSEKQLVIFSLIDLRLGHHQVKLHPDCRDDVVLLKVNYVTLNNYHFLNMNFLLCALSHRRHTGFQKISR